MNLFRSEEHMKKWPLHVESAHDHVMPLADWAAVFSASMFRRRLEPDFLEHSTEYLRDYRDALRRMGRNLPEPDRILSTVLFTDIVDSTKRAAEVGDSEWRELLGRHNQAVRDQLDHYDGREVKQTGDGFMASFPSPTRAIQCAHAICRLMPDLGLQVRTGVHTGEFEVFGSDLGGIGVHIAARVGAAARPGEVLVSRMVKDAVVGADFQFEGRGFHSLKGVPGSWELFAVTS